MHWASVLILLIHHCRRIDSSTTHNTLLYATRTFFRRNVLRTLHSKSSSSLASSAASITEYSALTHLYQPWTMTCLVRSQIVNKSPEMTHSGDRMKTTVANPLYALALAADACWSTSESLQSTLFGRILKIRNALYFSSQAADETALSALSALPGQCGRIVSI